MFQYACARALSLSNDMEIVLDNWLGFYRDYQFKRNYEIGSMPIIEKFARIRDRASLLACLASRKAFNNCSLIEDRLPFSMLITENQNQWISSLEQINFHANTWIRGYWQSPLYFQNIEDLIRQELAPPPSIKTNFKEMADKMKSCESLAIGIRLYEESSNPGIHAINGRLKSAKQVESAISKILKNNPKIIPFVFCTHRAPFLKQLNLPSTTVYLTHDDNFNGTMDRLWLLTQCKHHLFTNSTFYWWGAWLSSSSYAKEEQTITAADNFINSDSLCTGWNTF